MYKIEIERVGRGKSNCHIFIDYGLEFRLYAGFINTDNNEFSLSSKVKNDLENKICNMAGNIARGYDLSNIKRKKTITLTKKKHPNTIRAIDEYKKIQNKKIHS